MQDDENTYRDEVVRLCELAGDEGVLQGLGFVNCEIRGPAVLVALHSIIADSTWKGTPDSVLWEIPRSRPRVAGVIVARGCSFENCTFIRVGFAGYPDALQEIRNNVIWK